MVDLKFHNASAYMKINLPKRGLVQFFVNADDTVGGVLESIRSEDPSITSLKFFTYIQKY